MDSGNIVMVKLVKLRISTSESTYVTVDTVLATNVNNFIGSL